MQFPFSFTTFEKLQKVDMENYKYILKRLENNLISLNVVHVFYKLRVFAVYFVYFLMHLIIAKVYLMGKCDVLQS